MLKKVLKLFSHKAIVYLVILLGSISWSLVMVKSGLCIDSACSQGLGFWGANGHDGIWHLAIVNKIADGSFEMPIFSGENIKNYHLGFSFLLYVVKKLSGIPYLNLYFQVLPPLFALCIGFLAYRFANLWTGSKRISLWSLFFVYFGGSFGFLVDYIKNKKFGGESVFWAQQAVSSLINPPFALSLIFILLGLIFFIHYTKDKKIKNLILSSIFFGLLIQIKAYAGILVIFSLVLACVFEIYKKKEFLCFKVLILTVLISSIIFIPLNKNPQNLFIFKPFWFLETMMGVSDRVGWDRFYLAMTNYKLAGNFIKGTAAYAVAFLIFWYGNVGTRLISEFAFVKWYKEKTLSFIEVFIVGIIAGGTIIPMLFLQKGTPWNTIQFFYYSLFFLSFVSAVGMDYILSRKNKFIVSSLIIIFTIPTTLFTLSYHYLPKRPPAKIDISEFKALEYLAKYPSGVVLTYPFDKDKAKAQEPYPPRPLYLYESTAYVSAFSGKTVFLEDEVNLDITGFDWKKRREEIISWYKEKDEQKAQKFLKEKNIRYLYWLKGQRAYLGEGQLGLYKIFENDLVDIYEVKSFR